MKSKLIIGTLVILAVAFGLESSQASTQSRPSSAEKQKEFSKSDLIDIQKRMNPLYYSDKKIGRIPVRLLEQAYTTCLEQFHSAAVSSIAENTGQLQHNPELKKLLTTYGSYKDKMTAPYNKPVFRTGPSFSVSQADYYTSESKNLVVEASTQLSTTYIHPGSPFLGGFPRTTFEFSLLIGIKTDQPFTKIPTEFNDWKDPLLESYSITVVGDGGIPGMDAPSIVFDSISMKKVELLSKWKKSNEDYYYSYKIDPNKSWISGVRVVAPDDPSQTVLAPLYRNRAEENSIGLDPIGKIEINLDRKQLGHCLQNHLNESIKPSKR